MELIKKSTINETWKLCTLAGVLGLFLLTLLVTTTNPPSFQISISTTTFDDFSSPTPSPSKKDSAASEIFKGGESIANQTSYNEIKSTSSDQTIDNNTSNVLFKESSSNSSSAALEEELFVSSPDESINSTAKVGEYEIPTGESNHNSSSITLNQSSNSSAATNSTAGDREYEIPTGEANYNDSSNVSFQSSNSSAATNATTGDREYEIPTNEANYNNSSNVSFQSSNSSTAGEYEIPASQTNPINTSDVDALFQSVNSSGTLEDKLFSSSDSITTNATTVEYKIPTGETNNYNSSTVEEVELISSSAANASGSGGGGGEGKCRMYEGRWVYKPEENPRYVVYDCPFLEDKMSCRKNGRPDSDYEGWGWESDGCHVPLFNGADMLERLKGKRMIVVGDSLNRNMWESLACLLYTTIPRSRAFVDADDPAYKVLKAKDYEFTLEFYWAPFLVHLDEKHKSGRKVLSLDEVVPSSEQWRGADVMVFNSGHWWTHTGKLRAWDVFKYNGEFIEEMDNEPAYERALSTWAQWVATNVDPTKTKVYYRSISPEHKKQWCFNHSRPMGDDEPYSQHYPRSMIDVVERKIREANGREGAHVGIRYLNITGLSSNRIDAHPSIFRFKNWKVITEKYKRFLKARSDCSHWCLPGLPDTWNRILYASLFFDHLSPGDL